ncbi:MAG: DNA-binding protein [Oscillospiraceae bacterium]|nr:DNA-binding protein [Oscillospiraceae bacterium]MBR4928270.1 DNA-binding protein [Oscillospiraceae bacterium]MBR5045052.1 DNA-binding protein [Oscillospiraceae bacterium]MBR5071195.1 DNA-binding protein [Oscillospiraceae bacterium]MBR5979375.1 DNA-binding protein [Oscillospiraceae bacterium]
MAKDLSISSLIDTYSAVLTDNQRNVLRMYYDDDLSLGEIAELEGISRQGVRDTIKRGEAVLLELESQLHFKDKFSNFGSLTESIRRNAKDILAYIDSGGYTAQIKRAAQAIVEASDELDRFAGEEQ